ncbi:hypothetical protein [Dactylosporangium sp. NPDC000521]|uniref:hypothetical protein n=1 Tax=Dactylosporangium sp. NPDC000521 TaxID=3363975 RepID=UPI0036B278D2
MPRRSRRRVLIAVTAVVLLAAAAGLVYWRARDTGYLAMTSEYERGTDPRVVTVRLTIGPGDRVLRHEVAEDDTRVRISVWVRRASDNTPGGGVSADRTVTLRQPLAGRVVVDGHGTVMRERPG